MFRFKTEITFLSEKKSPSNGYIIVDVQNDSETCPVVKNKNIIHEEEEEHENNTMIASDKGIDNRLCREYKG